MAYTSVLNNVRSVGKALAANLKPDVDSVLRVLEPYQTPFMQFLFFGTKQSKVVTSKTAKFEWFEDELVPHQTTVTAAISESSGLTCTASNVTDIDWLKVNDLVYIEANDELAYVASLTYATDFDLQHIDGSSTLSDIAAGDVGSYLKCIGSVHAENSTNPVALSTSEVQKTNYLTIFSDLVSSTGRDQAGETYTDGTDHDAQVAKKMKEMKLQFERNFMLSPSAGVRTSSSIQTTYGKGLKGFFSTNDTTYAGSLGETAWDSHLDSVLEKGSGRKIHYCGSAQFMDLQQIVKDKVGNLQGAYTESYGVRFMNYIHGKGDVKIVWNPVLDGKFTNWGFTIDESHCTPRHMANDKKGSRKFRIEANVETPGQDISSTRLLADVGIQYSNEETGGILRQS